MIAYRIDFELEHGAFPAILAPILDCTVSCKSTDLRSKSRSRRDCRCSGGRVFAKVVTIDIVKIDRACCMSSIV